MMPWYAKALGRGGRWLWAHRYLFGIPVATLTALATVYAVRLPDEYTAKTTLEVKSLNQMHGSTLPTEREVGLEQLMQVTQARLTSQRPVEAIAPILIRDKDLTPIERIEAARKRVQYDQQGDYNFTVAISDTDPKRALDAVEALVDTFLEEQRREPLERETQAVAFYKKRHDAAKEALQKAVDAKRLFEQDNAATLPQQAGAIQQKMLTFNLELQTEKNNKEKIREQIIKIDEQIAFLRSRQDAGMANRSPSAEERRLDGELQAKRESHQRAELAFREAERKYQPGYSKYEDAKDRLAQAKAEYERVSDALSAARKRADDAARTSSDQRIRQELDSMNRRKGEAERAMEKKEADILYITAEREKAQNLLNAVADTKRQLDPLVDDVVKAEKEVANQKRELDRHDELAAFYANSPLKDVTRYRVSQAPVLPTKPSGPPRMRWVLTGLLLGGVLGYLLLLARRRFVEAPAAQPADLEKLLPGALVVTVPELDGQGRDVRKGFSIKEGVMAGWVVGCLALTIFAIAAYKGMIDAPSWLQKALGMGG